MRPALASDEFVSLWLTQHPRWRRVDDRLVATYALSYEQSIAVLTRTLETVNELDHHPLCQVGYDEMTVTLWTHDRGGITELDMSLAHVWDDVVGVIAPSLRERSH